MNEVKKEESDNKFFHFSHFKQTKFDGNILFQVKLILIV